MIAAMQAVPLQERVQKLPLPLFPGIESRGEGRQINIFVPLTLALFPHFVGEEEFPMPMASGRGSRPTPAQDN